MTCSVLLLGGSGYVGNAFQSFFAAQEITFHNFRRAEVDYTNFSALEKVLREFAILRHQCCRLHRQAECGCL